MYECIDSSNKIYSVEDYCLLKKTNNHPKEIYCPLCNIKVYIRGENSISSTHFMHKTKKFCLNKDYSELFNSSSKRKSKEDVCYLKYTIIKFSYDIFMHIKNTFNINITHIEFLNILKNIREKNVLKLLDITPEIIPYIFINELGTYKNMTFLYTNSINENNNKLWNLSNKKDCILCVVKNSNQIINKFKIPIDKTFLQNPYKKIPFEFIVDIIPKIYECLKIDYCFENQLLEELLNKT